MLVTNTFGNILINIVVYAVLFNIIYSILFSGIRYPKSASVITYIVVMEIKLFIAQNRISLISLIVYLLLGIGIIILFDKIGKYKSKRYFIIMGIIVGYIAELLLARILFIVVIRIIDVIMAIIGIVMFLIRSIFTGTADFD